MFATSTTPNTSTFKIGAAGIKFARFFASDGRCFGVLTGSLVRPLLNAYLGAYPCRRKHTLI